MRNIRISSPNGVLMVEYTNREIVIISPKNPAFVLPSKYVWWPMSLDALDAFVPLTKPQTG